MKLALIGGGSVRTVYFVRSFALYAKRLGFESLSIMDNDAEKLRIFGGLARYEGQAIAAQQGINLAITLTDDFTAAVTDADYIVTTLRVGGDEARVLDERVALSHGVIGQETTGAGGFAYALRTIPVLLDYMRIIREKAPHATVFNFTNPSGLVTQALHSAGYDNVVGICDNASGIKANMSKLLRMNASDFKLRTYGLNHLTWSDQVTIGGKDILSKLFEHDAFVENFDEFGYFDKDLIRLLRSVPNGYLYYYYHSEKALHNVLSAGKTRGENILDINRQMLAALRPLDIDKNAAEALHIFTHYMHLREGSYMAVELGGHKQAHEAIDIASLGIEELDPARENIELYEGYAGVAFNYIQAVRENKPVEIALNVQNNGAVPGLCDTDVVEISCRIDKDGVHRDQIPAQDIPERNLLLIKTIKQYERLTVEAVSQRSVALAREALMIHPLVNSYSLAKDLVADYLKAHSAYLGAWR